MKKKILIIMTNIPTYGKSNAKTGLWLEEATEFIEFIDKNKFDIEFASPKGGIVPLDPRSLKSAKKNSLSILNKDKTFIEGIRNSQKISTISNKKYDAIYFTGGHGVMWDFYGNEDIHTLIENAVKNDSYILSVCHGIAALLDVKIDNKYLIDGVKLTGFTTTEEWLSGKKKLVPFLNEVISKNNNATFIKKRFFKSNVVVDNKFITGQNPFSTVELAKKANQIIN